MVYKIQCGDLRSEKFRDNTDANGEKKVRAPMGHDFTQAQHLIQRAASTVKSSKIAEVGHTSRHSPQDTHRLESNIGR